MCMMFKIQFKALSFFVSELFKSGWFDKENPIDAAAILKSALLINENVDIDN